MSKRLAMNMEHQVSQARKVKALQAENSKLRSAIRWALGEVAGFRGREDGEGACWWRTELRERSGIK